MPAQQRPRKTVLPARKISFIARRTDYKTIGVYALAAVFTLYMLTLMSSNGKQLPDGIDDDPKPAPYAIKQPSGRNAPDRRLSDDDLVDGREGGPPRSRKYGAESEPDEDAVSSHVVNKPSKTKAQRRQQGPPAIHRQNTKARNKHSHPTSHDEEEDEMPHFDKTRLTNMLEETIHDALTHPHREEDPSNYRQDGGAGKVRATKKTAEEFLKDFDAAGHANAAGDPYLDQAGSAANVFTDYNKGNRGAAAARRQQQQGKLVDSNDEDDDFEPFPASRRNNKAGASDKQRVPDRRAPFRAGEDEGDEDTPFERKGPKKKALDFPPPGTKKQQPTRNSKVARNREEVQTNTLNHFKDADDASFAHKAQTKHHPSFHQQEDIDDEELGNPLDDYENVRRHSQGYDDDDEFGAEVEAKLATQYKPMRDPPGPLRFGRDGVALNFNWTEYLRMYPELRMSHVTNEKTARQHYAKYGKNEGRLPRVPQIYMQYTACKMVYEQYYSHLAAFVIARELQAELVLPPSLIKDADGFWQPMFLEAVMNVSAVLEAAFEVGQMFHKVHASDFASMPDFNEEGFKEDNAYPEYKYLETPEKYIIRVSSLYNKMRNLKEVVDEIYNRIGMQGVKDFKNGDWGGGSEFTLLLDLPCTFFAIDARSALPQLQDASHLIYFPQHLIHMADDAIKALSKKGVKKFNGLIIKNHEDWLAYTTTKFPTYWYKYKKAIEHELKNASLPCYVGFEELVDVQAGWDKLNRQLIDSTGACSKVFTKYQLLDEDAVNKLHDQQQSLVDFMVLYRARVILGNYKSLMVLFLNEYRHSKGNTKGRLVRVQTKIETDKDDNEVDPLSWGGVFTTRHRNGFKDLPQLFLGPKGYKLKQKQHAVEYNPFKNLS